MKAKRMNTNAIKGNKMTTMQETRKFKVWKEKLHVQIDTRRKSTKQKKELGDTKVKNKYCQGELCMKKKQDTRNVVDSKGEECKACYAEEFNKMRIGRAQYDISIPLEYSIASKVAF
jgi:hypothetical protein